MPFALASSLTLLLWLLPEPMQYLLSLLWLSVAIFFSRSYSLTSCTKPLQQQALLLQLTSPIPSSGFSFWQVLVHLLWNLLSTLFCSLGFTLQLLSRTPLLFLHPTLVGNLLGSDTLFLHLESLAGLFYHCSQSLWSTSAEMSSSIACILYSTNNTFQPEFK